MTMGKANAVAKFARSRAVLFMAISDCCVGDTCTNFLFPSVCFRTMPPSCAVLADTVSNFD